MAISISRITVYRDPRTGRLISKEAHRRGVIGERVIMDVQRSKSGRIIRAIQVLSRKTTVKTAKVDTRGPQAGRLDWALFATNITTKLKDARRFEITVRGKSQEGKSRRVKHVINVGPDTKPAKISDYLIYGVIQALRQRGYRTQYNLAIVKAESMARVSPNPYRYKDWATGKVVESPSFTTKKGKFWRWSKIYSQQLRQLRDVEMTVKVIKR